MRKLKNPPATSFRAIGRRLALKVEMVEGRLMVMAPMWRKALSTESSFCKAVVAAGYLSEWQMERAARRYRLGASVQGGVIYWQTDSEERTHDGKVMYYRKDCHRDKQHTPTWVSALLQRRYQWPDKPRASHCLFGLHQLSADFREQQRGLPAITDETVVAVVEAEKTAVILSEWQPQCLWLATGGLGEVQPEKFRPLRGRRVVLFPDTDPEGEAFRRWYEAARAVEAMVWWQGCLPIHVSPLLELHASEDQKRRKIDLVDFMAEGGK